MQRAAVLIGVDATGGGLPRLHAAAAGARQMGRWALEQGFAPELVHVITDQHGAVDISAIKRAIREIVELTTVEQLVVYFAGHGVNIRYGEYWLLSDAPDDSQAAVNVEGSIVLARQCGIPHVVLFSDACRTAEGSVQGQAVTGSEIFPNVGPSLLEQAVDVFFACALGRPALEVRDPLAARAAYSAVYTDALVEALHGRRAEVLEPVLARAGRVGLVRPRPLKRHLHAEVVRRLTVANVAPGISQTPDARITSDDVWLARCPLPAVLAAPPRRRGARPAPGPRVPPTLSTVSATLLHTALAEAPREPDDLVGRPGVADVAGSGLLLEPLGRTAPAFGPMHFETDCGFKVRGARVIGVHSRAELELLDPTIVRVHHSAGPPVDVLIEFEDGTGTVLPAIPGFLGGLTVEDGELVDVGYEPSDRTPRWEDQHARYGELRTLRALLAASARYGALPLEDARDAGDLARAMQVATGIDPTAALYAGYAYAQLGDRSRIRQMLAQLDADLAFRPFDLVLLAGGPDGRPGLDAAGASPFAPLLSPGWAQLRAHRVELPPGLTGLARHLQPSLWSVFDPRGVALIGAAMRSEEI